MSQTVNIKIQPQSVAYVDCKVRNVQLHKTQQLFYNFENLPEITIIIAPTGTGKSFAFPLPIVQAKDSGSPFVVRKGLIVSPTNALIEDMKNQFTEKFSDIKTTVLNAVILDERDAHGLERWKEIQRIINKNDIIITNPDLLNFALMSGYTHHVKGQRQWTDVFLEQIDYFVFDEYHLYDEEQIANILCLILIRQKLMPSFKSKFIFASATPERGLEEFLTLYDISYKVFQEEITREKINSRVIHGELTVHFVKETNVVEYISQHRTIIENAITEGKRILIILDKLREIHQAKPLLKKWFPSFKVAEDSGYMTRAEKKEDVKAADIILGTNKVEVGVNLNVDLCLMKPGRYFQNFLQRFGRVARGNQDGEVFIFVDKLKKIRETYQNDELCDYYSFIQRYGEIAEQHKFYMTKIPSYIGAMFFAVQHHTNDWDLKQLLRNKIVLEGEAKSIYFAMSAINGKIRELSKINERCGKGFSYDVNKWNDWWKAFLETFRYFRSQNIIAQIIDLDFGENWQTCYSLEWILRNKNVINKETIDGKEYYIVAGLRDEKQPFVYLVDTLPVGDLFGERIILQNQKYKLKNAFIKSLAEVEEKYKGRSDEFSKKCHELVKNVARISVVFSDKRLKIREIIIQDNIL